MIKRSLRFLLALAIIVVWWFFTPSLFRAEWEFGIEIPDGVESKWTTDRVYGPSRTMTALGFYDRWEEGSCTVLIIPGSRLVEFLEQFDRLGYAQSGGRPWSPDALLRETGLREQSLCFHTTHLRDYKFGDYLVMRIQRLADDTFECEIWSNWN